MLKRLPCQIDNGSTIGQTDHCTAGTGRVNRSIDDVTEGDRKEPPLSSLRRPIRTEQEELNPNQPTKLARKAAPDSRLVLRPNESIL